MAHTISYTEIGEQVLALQAQSKALLATCNTLLRQLAPLVEQEAAKEGESSERRVFGQSQRG